MAAVPAEAFAENTLSGHLVNPPPERAKVRFMPSKNGPTLRNDSSTSPGENSSAGTAVKVVIKRKGSKNNQEIAQEVDNEHEIAYLIERGGAVAKEEPTQSSTTDVPAREFRFTLRGPASLLQEIDQAKKSRIGSVSRNQWILEAIEERLHSLKSSKCIVWKRAGSAE